MKTYCAKIFYASPNRVCPNGYLISEKTLFNYFVRNGETVYFSLEKLIDNAKRFLSHSCAFDFRSFFVVFEIKKDGFFPLPYILLHTVESADNSRN